ncbi:hypothetical protein [Inquilinus limosus]|uniref:Uncharacterized protein n=1 Tax=Inquilinus limosus TaxID=171674 RepID=A0A211ZJ12_9PROT|nr:hypothetical protein [Inquilinus limosus]OWJ65285.1 hypothetical protein BWR60_20570 [Inquilinus limosus]
MAKIHTVLFAGFFMTGLAGCGSSQTTAPAPQAAETPAPAVATVNEAGKLRVNPRDFEAWLNTMPGEAASLHVEGKLGAVTAPSSGWTVTLVDSDRTAGRRTKVLELWATAPSDPATQALTPMEVPPFVEDPAKANYSRVTIWYGKRHFTVRVKTVQ